MPSIPCKGCGKSISGRLDRRTSFCVDCVRKHRCSDCGQLLPASGEHHRASVDLKGPRFCADCGKRLENHGYERWKNRCGRCEKIRWRRKERERRAAAKARFGGKCGTCGYDRCQFALHFHHKNNGAEKYDWSRNGGADIREIERRPGRFELICANCHIELHFGQKRWE